MSRRNVSIELYRIFLMFGICWLHCCQQGGMFEKTRVIYYLMRPTVVGFVFISGWFGVNCSVIKIAKLFLVSVSCVCLSVLLKYIVTGGASAVADIAYSFVAGYWFLWAYLALLMVSPILNAAIEGENKFVNKRIVPLLVMVFGWSFLTHIPIIKTYIPCTAGVTALSFVMMAGVYSVARIIRLRNYDRLFNGFKFWIGFIVSIVFCGIGFSHFDSIFSLYVAVGLFQMFRLVHVPVAIGRVVLLISSSMFPVYILHQAYRGFNLIEFGMNVSVGLVGDLSPMLCTLFTAIFVFISCLTLDVLRRAFVTAIGRLILLAKTIDVQKGGTR